MRSNAAILNVRNYGATGNGITNDTQAFQKCVDILILKGGGLILVPAGTYAITHLTFFGKAYSNISIVGQNATIYQLIEGKRKSVENGKFNTFALRHAADGCFVFDAQVSAQKDDRNSIKNIRINGLNFLSHVEKYGFDELLHQISAHGVSHFTVENCTFTGFLGDGIAINGGTDFSTFHDAYNKDVKIRNCKFNGINKNNRQAISIYYSDGFKIEHCDFKNTTRNDMPGAIDIEPDREINISRNGIISNCTFKNIGGIGAVTFNLRNASLDNQLRRISYVVENCTFSNVSVAFAVIGNAQKNAKIVSNDIIFRNCKISDARSHFLFNNAENILISKINFKKVDFPPRRPSFSGLNENLRFVDCAFSSISCSSKLIFYGTAKNILFIDCIFSGKRFLEINYAKINSLDKFKNINFYYFLLIHYRAYLLLTILIFSCAFVLLRCRKKNDNKK